MLEIIRNARDGVVAPKANGFSGNAREILEGLDGLRRSRPAWENMSLGKYLGYWEFETNKTNKIDLSVDHQNELVREFMMSLGFLDIGRVTVKRLRTNTADATQSWLFPELIRAYIEEGAGTGSIHQSVVAATENVEGERIAIMPTIKFVGKPKRLGELEDIPTARVEYRSRNVPILPHGLGMKFSYDALDGMSMDMFGKFLATQGAMVGLGMDASMIDVLYNGDQYDNSMSAAVIGVDNTTNGFQYSDFLRAAILLAGQGFMLDTLIMSFNDAKSMFNIDEFKLRGEGTALIVPERNIPLPSTVKMFAKSNATDGKIIALDSRNAVVEFVGEPMLIENQKFIFERQEGTAITSRVGFANLYRTGRLVIDTANTYGSAGFGIDDYDWFEPIDLFPAANI